MNDQTMLCVREELVVYVSHDVLSDEFQKLVRLSERDIESFSVTADELLIHSGYSWWREIRPSAKIIDIASAGVANSYYDSPSIVGVLQTSGHVYRGEEVRITVHKITTLCQFLVWVPRMCDAG